MVKAKEIQSGQTVELKFKVKAIPKSNTDNNYIESDESEYSNKFYYSSSSIVKINTPTDVSIDDDYNAIWTAPEGTNYYWLIFNINGKDQSLDGEPVFLNKSTEYSYGNTENGIFKANIEKAISSFYSEMVKTKEIQAGQTVELKFKVKAEPNKNNNYIESNLSTYSNIFYFNCDGSTKIDNITLFPNKPIIAVGKSIYIGKTIKPNNAIYEKINWSTSDSSVVSINNMGQITGLKKGKATITAKINNATQNADVCVYDIGSNIKNSDESSSIINEANDVIEAITKNEDISNTDIIDKESVLNEIEQAAQDGDMFSVNIKYDEKNATNYNKIKDIIDSRHEEYNIAGGNDIRIAISHTDDKGSEHHIANITELEKEINVEFDIPNDIPALDKTKKREFKLIRLHNDNIEDVDFEIRNGKVDTSSDKFSDFVLLYKDIDLPTFNLSGTITSYNYETDDIIVKLYRNNDTEVFDEKIVKGNSTNYSFENVPAGDYVVELTKNNHVSRNYAITLENSNLNLDTKICLIGDINEDGKVNIKDWNKLYEQINETGNIKDYSLLCADVNNDGKINVKDLNRLYEHISEVNPLF